MAATKRNVIIMLADQLRADCLGCYDNARIRTPHIDDLARSGTRFAAAFAQHPQCVPSRAALLTGRYPHENGSISNHCAMGEHEVTLGEYYKRQGYRSIGVGKLHIYGHHERRGFTETMLCGGQQSDATTPDVLREDYKQWLKENGYWEDAVKAYAIHGTEEYWRNFRANVNPMPVEAYIDTWVGDRAVEYIEQQSPDQPFFMFVGFANPHIPFDAPEPYASMYDPKDVPVPETFPWDLDNKPPQHIGHKRHARKENFEQLDEERLRKVIALYYGSITLVDDQVGKVLSALESHGLAENTVIVFVSDHGELLGHYGMLIKSVDKYPLLYDVGIRVPLIVREPGAEAARVVGQPVELVDLAPTLMECTGLRPTPEMQGESFHAVLRGEPWEPKEFVFSETGAVKSLRNTEYKLVYYSGQPYGELYRISEDPSERSNLYDVPDYREVRDHLIRCLLDRLIQMEAPIHGESRKGPAFWRTLYSLPFEEEPVS